MGKVYRVDQSQHDPRKWAIWIRRRNLWGGYYWKQLLGLSFGSKEAAEQWVNRQQGDAGGLSR